MVKFYKTSRLVVIALFAGLVGGCQFSGGYAPQPGDVMFPHGACMIDTHGSGGHLTYDPACKQLPGG